MSHNKEASPIWWQDLPAFKQHVVDEIKKVVTPNEKDVEGIEDITQFVRERVERARQQMMDEINKCTPDRILDKINKKLIEDVRLKRSNLNELNARNANINRKWDEIESNNSNSSNDLNCVEDLFEANNLRKKFAAKKGIDTIGEQLHNDIELSIKQVFGEAMSRMNAVLGYDCNLNDSGSNRSKSKPQS